MKIKKLAALIVTSAVTSCLSISAFASSSHYVPGIEGVKASAVPPAGVYYKGYAINYTADKLVDGPANSKVTVNALAHRFIWVTPQKLLGGDLTLEAILPMVSTDLKIAGGAVKDKQTGLGDFYLGSVIGWHGERWDAVGGIGYWADTGKFDKAEPASPGKGHDAIMLTFGGNFKLNQQGDMTFSVLGRYEMPNKSGLNDELLLEWGLGKSYGALDVGFIGYNTVETGDGKEKRNALGLSVGHFWPSIMLGADIAAYKEYSNKNTFEGRVLRASLTKVF